MWIAEGFVSQEEVAEAFIDLLVSRNLFQPVFRNIYSVHSLMLGLLVCKAKEDNFAACSQYNGPSGSCHAKQIRHLSLHFMDRCPDEDLSHIRSLVISGEPRPDGVTLDKFANLRVLEINCDGLLNSDLVDMSRLMRLRYLGLKGVLITKLPWEIWKLQRLEILDASRTSVTELPTEVEKLQHLRTLNISGTKVTELPTEITKLELLKNLDVSWTGVRELPKEIKKLQHLSTLDIRGTMVRELSWEIPNSLSVLVGDKVSSQVMKLPQAVSADGVIPSSGVERREDLSIVFYDPFNTRWLKPLEVPLLRVYGRHLNVPQWLKQDLRHVSSLDIRLCKLGEDDLKFLKEMPNLQAIALRFEVLPWEPIAITGEGFSKLEAFYFDCRLPQVTFEEGAMPKLKHLEFKFYTGTTSQAYSMGIKNLDSLEKVVFGCSEYYTSGSPGVCETIDVVRKEAAEHHNKITLCIQGMIPEVLGTSGINLASTIKAIAGNEFVEWIKETENWGREIKEKAERICEQRHRLLTAVDRRVQREKSSTNIDKEIRDQFVLFEPEETENACTEEMELDKQLLGIHEKMEIEERVGKRIRKKMGIEERVGRARDQSLRLLTKAERPAEWKKNNPEIEKEIQKTISILEKSFVENMKKKAFLRNGN